MPISIKTPHVRICPKCGYSEVNIKYIKKEATVNLNSDDPEMDEFVYSVRTFNYIIKARREHLQILCLTCGYEYREHTLDHNDNHPPIDP